MKRWKRIALAALCAALVLLAAAPASGSSAEVYLMAVNDRVLTTTAGNMPTVVGGVLYVPYTMLSSRDGSINLGVTAMYSTTRRTVMVSDDGQRGVEFDTRSNTAQDISGNPVSARAVVRNSMVLLPIDWLCQYFGTISCTRTQTRYGTLVRVTNSAAILSDRDFVDAADNLLADSLRTYLSTVNGEGNEPVPSAGVQPTAPPSGAELFLAFRWGSESQECARALESREQRGLFLFTARELREQGDLVRCLVGAGHTVGLALTGEDGPECLAQAEKGRELLAAAARYNALVVSAGALDEGGREALSQAGYVVWVPTVQGNGWSTGRALVRGLSLRRVNYVELECGPGSAALLREALRAMAEENCQLYQATAPALS